mmetsp:Transcript_41820/g.108259  ORF Transcript_41820/g.108259 Transcript_41820/m.108259 type:complete len:354 (-) Transcript_41820:147-1208(-)
MLLHRFMSAHRQQLRGLWLLQQQQAAHGAIRHLASKPDVMALVKELRARSGAPIKDVKAALEEGGWDMEAAFAALRKKGLAAAAKKGDRTTLEGLVALAEGAGRGALVEVNCETDFVARNDTFQSLLGNVAQAALTADATAVDAATCEILPVGVEAVRLPNGQTVGEAVAEVAGTVRENVQFRRALLVESNGALGTYLHSSPAPGLGRIAAMVSLEAADGSALEGAVAAAAGDLARKLAMHVVAAKPAFLDRGTVSSEALEAETAVLSEQAAASGKPPAIVEKMVLGRLSKFYEEVCLLDQKFVMDDSKTISKVVKEAGVKLGVELRLTKYVRVGVGEGKTASEAESEAASAV